MRGYGMPARLAIGLGMFYVAAAWAQPGTVGAIVQVGNVIVRDAFHRPVGTFAVDVTYGRVKTDTFARSSVTQHLICGDEPPAPHPEHSIAGLVVAFECETGVTIRVGAETKTFLCAPEAP